MISPTELRLGNWFNNPAGSPVRVCGITQSSRRVLIHPKIGPSRKPATGLDPAACCPIRITAAILERSDFEWHGVEWRIGGFSIAPGPEGFTHHHSDALVLQYVHQLQNLFFAITGKELSVTFEDAQAQDKPESKALDFSFRGRATTKLRQREEACVREALRQVLKREPKPIDAKNCQRLAREGVDNRWVLAYKGVPLGSIRSLEEAESEVSFLFTAGDCSL